MQEIFFNGNGVIPAKQLAELIYNNEDKLGKVTADVEWPDGSPAQIRFELDVPRDEAETLVDDMNTELESDGYDDATNGCWWLGNEYPTNTHN